MEWACLQTVHLCDVWQSFFFFFPIINSFPNPLSFIRPSKALAMLVFFDQGFFSSYLVTKSFGG